ncbi:MAG: Diguanylate cyclase (GGDEF) domain-containing protein [Candidatus Tokpelaia sp. JSC085]|nr:MAG: Diguanylate cyclase (GGDEF) domain-containing protein [Candidatus Tokpelaia sp. JSC085]
MPESFFFACADEPIKITSHDTALDLSSTVQIYINQGKTFQVSTAPGPDGIVRRIEVQGNDEKKSAYNWAVFSVANPTDEQIDRLIVAPHYRLSHSGLLNPDLGSIRIQSITPSEGFALDRQASPDSDVFFLKINPGSVITLVAELRATNLPQLYLWDPQAYKDTVNAYTLFHGILLGISSLLALLLTILSFVRGHSLFVATAALAWAALAYICVDCHFFRKLFENASSYEPIWRAGTEVVLTASMLVFLFSYLHLHKWHWHFRFGVVLWILALCGLGTLTAFDPSRAAGIARVSLGLATCIGIILISYLSYRRYDRAIMLIPTWVLIISWQVGTYATVTGRIDNNIMQDALVGNLVLIVLLISFTVMQHAFSGGIINQGLFSDLERKALAIMGTENIVWDWDVRYDRVFTNPDLSLYLGAAAKNLAGPMRNWLPVIHGEDQDRFRISLDSILDARRGKLNETFRLRSGDGQYRWFSLHARPVIGTNGQIIRCVGMMMDMTTMKNIEEHLFQDSTYDNLTHLPNKNLLLDRLQNYCNLATLYKDIRPTLLVVDFDNFRAINKRYGMSASDTFLLTIARRLSRHLKPLDTLCRLSVDRFVLLLISENNLSKVAAFALLLKKTLSMPVTFTKYQITLTASIGLLPWISDEARAEARLNDAILAMYYAKCNGGNRIEAFQPIFRTAGLEKKSRAEELRHALMQKTLFMVYHPVFNMTDGVVAGFEASPQWSHAAHGVISIDDFISTAEHIDLTMQITHFVLSRVSIDLACINEQFPGNKFFVAINIPSAQLLRPELLNRFQSILVRTPLREGQLQIKLSEKMLMQNPELSFLLCQRLKTFGIGLILNNFGLGYAALDYFIRFPFDMIALDRSLFNGEKQNGKIILKSLINMAHDLGLKVIANGVENDHIAFILKDAHCEYLQSNAFHEPMQINKIITILEKNKNLKR